MKAAFYIALVLGLSGCGIDGAPLKPVARDNSDLFAGTGDVAQHTGASVALEPRVFAGAVK
ncbi:MAG: hypothetical protein ACI9IV_001184 [Paracoccaceae bacterium]|jgi:hypothetical protein|tara:strand:+ start:216 stop:398 length:183 start_codon:yes stop_codon:yes gene_type:complete